MHPDVWSKKRVTFWVALGPVMVVSVPVVVLGALLLGSTPISREQIAKVFLARLAGECAPEAVEQIAYVLAVLVPVGLMMLALWGLARSRLTALGPAWPRWVRRCVLGTQGVVVAAWAFGWLYESIWGRHYFREWASLGVVAAALGAWAAYGRWAPPAVKASVLAACAKMGARPWIAWAVATLWTAGLLLTCVFTNAGIREGQPTRGYHLDFTMGEFAAALNGRTPLVDFFPQYQNLSPLLLAPVFELIGFDVTRFTLVMCLLSLVGLLMVYAVLTCVAGTRWLGLALYLPFATASFLHASRLPGGHYTNAFNYFAVGPLRYFGVFALALATVWYLRSPSLRRLLVAALAGSAVALNNLDFGAPATLGLLFVALLFPPQDLRAWRPRTLAQVTGGWLVATVAGLAVCMLSIRLARGAWPALAHVALFQQSFAVYGFAMVPLPPAGLYWIVYLTFMAAVLIALHESMNEGPSTDAREHRLANGMLAYGGVAGFGAMTYYIGRSHSSVLVAILCAWLFVVVQLALRAWRDWRRLAQPDGTPWFHRLGLPSSALLVLCLLLAHEAVHYPNPVVQAQRIAHSATAADDSEVDILALITKYVPPDERTVIVSPRAHWLALRAGVNNEFPFAHSLSLLVKPQVDVVMDTVAKLPADRQLVLGAVPAEMASALRAAGFAAVEAQRDFVVWARPAPLSPKASITGETTPQ